MAVYSQATSTGYYTLYLDITETSVNVENNTSNVRYSVYFVGAASTTAYGSNANCTATVNGVVKTVSNVSYNMSNNKTCNLITNESVVNIAHNEDGTKSISFNIQLNAGSYVGSATLTGTFTLTTIARNPLVKVKVSNAWRNGKVRVKVNGTWRNAKKVFVKVNGAWKESKLRG